MCISDVDRYNGSVKVCTRQELGDRNTPIQRYTDTSIQRYTDTLIQRYTDTSIHRYIDTTIQPFDLFTNC